MLEAFACFWVTVDSFKGKKVESGSKKESGVEAKDARSYAIKIHIDHPRKNINLVYCCKAFFFPIVLSLYLGKLLTEDGMDQHHSTSTNGIYILLLSILCLA